ncbi:hypothetical protein D3C81_1029090 [compost metagenome]
MFNSGSLTLAYTDECIDPGFGYENLDGYVRVWNLPKGTPGARLVMRHRWFYEFVYGRIPEGYEVDHKCKNRRCVNDSHLQLLKSKDHRTKDNGERYKDVIEMGCAMLKAGHSKTEVEEATGRSRATINSWLRKYKEETN